MRYDIREVTRGECEPFIIGIHYAHRWPSISKAYGLFRGGELVGVCTYGTPPSAPLRTGIAGSEYSAHIMELNRLCLRDNVKNEASILISGSLKLIGDKIIISFADTEQGHVGYVYQACNFLYCGLSAKRTDWKIKGMEHLHGQTIADKYRGVQNRAASIRADYGDDFYLKDRPRKHRYIYISGARRLKKNAISALKYKIEDYPKVNHA